MNVTKKQWDELNRRLTIAIRDVGYLVQVVRQNRGIIQYLANRDATVDASITVTPVTTFPLVVGSDATGVLTRKPSEFQPIIANQLYEHVFATAVVP